MAPGPSPARPCASARARSSSQRVRSVAALSAQRVERHAIETGSLLVAGHPDGTLAGSARVVDRLRGVPSSPAAKKWCASSARCGSSHPRKVPREPRRPRRCGGDDADPRAPWYGASRIRAWAKRIRAGAPGTSERTFPRRPPRACPAAQPDRAGSRAPAPGIELPPEHGGERSVPGNPRRGDSDAGRSLPHARGDPSPSGAAWPTSPRRPSVASSRTTSPMKTGCPRSPG